MNRIKPVLQALRPLTPTTMSSDSRPIYEGVFSIHKPPGITSAGAIERVKKQFNTSQLFAPWMQREQARHKENNKSMSRDPRAPKWKRPKKFKSIVKMGHGGTLDPEATGVLIVGVGRGTKCLSRFLACTKVYEATVLFGAATDSYDREGKIIGRAPFEHLTKDGVEKALERFRGKIMQKPPVFSALNVNGKRMYEYARGGGEIPDIPEREVTVEKLELSGWLEGGTHEYRYPEKEAPAEEKKAAERILGTQLESSEASNSKRQKISNEDGPEPLEAKTETVSATAEEQPQADSSIIEKDTSNDDLVTSPVNQEPTSDATLMSGALQGETTVTAKDSRPFPQETSTEAGPQPPAAQLSMTVSSGFYVRSLSYDLGKAVGSLAFMAALVRTRQGDFTLGTDTVLEFEDLGKGEEVWGPKVQAMLSKWMESEGWNEESSD